MCAHPHALHCCICCLQVIKVINQPLEEKQQQEEEEAEAAAAAAAAAAAEAGVPLDWDPEELEQYEQVMRRVECLSKVEQTWQAPAVCRKLHMAHRLHVMSCLGACALVFAPLLPLVVDIFTLLDRTGIR